MRFGERPGERLKPNMGTKKRDRPNMATPLGKFAPQTRKKNRLWKKMRRGGSEMKEGSRRGKRADSSKKEWVEQKGGFRGRGTPHLQEKKSEGKKRLQKKKKKGAEEEPHCRD